LQCGNDERAGTVREQLDAAFVVLVPRGGGRVERASVDDQHLRRRIVVAAQYLDLPLGVVDASVIARAERHGVETIATLDHRHFGTVKPRHLHGFHLAP
jgi:uncharacterized protein